MNEVVLASLLLSERLAAWHHSLFARLLTDVPPAAHPEGSAEASPGRRGSGAQASTSEALCWDVSMGLKGTRAKTDVNKRNNPARQSDEAIPERF